MYKLAMAVAVTAIFSTQAVAGCKDPAYIAQAKKKGDWGSAVPSLLLLPATAAMAAITQPLRLVPGGKKHAENTLCVVKSQVRDVTSD